MATEGSAVQGNPMEHAGKMVDEAKALSGGISQKAGEVRAYVAELDIPGRIRENPLAFAGAALGVGYVLGGGLFSRPTGWFLKNGLRLSFLFAGAKALTSKAAAATSAAKPSKPKRARPSGSKAAHEND